MFDVNQVTLYGRLTRDPELKSLPSGTSVCDVGLAIGSRRKNRDTDQWEDGPTTFVNISIFGGIGENVARQCSKGSPLLVVGELRFRQWEAPDGGKRSALDVVARQAIPTQRGERQAAAAASGGGASPEGAAQPWTGGSGADDDIPF